MPRWEYLDSQVGCFFMINIRKSQERGHADHGWLDTYHTFSFGDYYDPGHMGFRSLRVINEDIVAPGQGFGTHPHRDMEIVTYVLQGALEHKDSMGTGSVIRPGDVQRMSAGTGVTHSEFNPSRNEPVHLLQIWLLPERKGLAPSYEQKSFTGNGSGNSGDSLALLASHDGDAGSVSIHQDAKIYAVRLGDGQSIEHEIDSSRYAWIQLVRGRMNVNGVQLELGDAAAISDERLLTIQATGDSEALLFDLA